MFKFLLSKRFVWIVLTLHHLKDSLLKMSMAMRNFFVRGIVSYVVLFMICVVGLLVLSSCHALVVADKLFYSSTLGKKDVQSVLVDSSNVVVSYGQE